jgi:hypothetical protein
VAKNETENTNNSKKLDAANAKAEKSVESLKKRMLGYVDTLKKTNEEVSDLTKDSA